MQKLSNPKNHFYANRLPAPLDKRAFVQLPKNSPPYAPDLNATVSDYLFCLPYDLGQFYLCLQLMLPFIKEHPTQVRLVIHQSLYPLVRELDPSHLYPILITELDQHQFPTSETLLALLQQPYKVAVDFNYPSLATTTFLVAKACARYRIGLQSLYAEELFNVVIACNGENSLENAYQRIRQLILTQFA